MTPTEQLTALKSRLSARDLLFAESLLSAAKSRGLSEKQAYWVSKLVERAQQEGSKTTIPCARLFQLLDKAKEKLLWPKIRFSLSNNKQFILGLGQHNDKAFLRPSNDSAFGVLLRDGTLSINRPHKHYPPSEITSLLTAFDDDPATAAKLFGQRFSNCCFCGLTLTDAESIRLGYGPICAENWGLPHNAARKGLKVELNAADFADLDSLFEEQPSNETDSADDEEAYD